ncbi:MAG TPA: hypothetical protein VN918_12410, partial [Myxococcaceae bacterium]|nr:hypothetical protein [Myxococcaceae bacterium]
KDSDRVSLSAGTSGQELRSPKADAVAFPLRHLFLEGNLANVISAIRKANSGLPSGYQPA